MAALMLLPNELVGMILQHLTTVDLVRLTGTCRALHKSLTPQIYEHLKLTWSNADGQHQNQRRIDLLSLLRILKENLTYADLVRTLTFRAENWSVPAQPEENGYSSIVKIPGWWGEQELNNENEALLRRIAQDLELDPGDDWINNDESRSWSQDCQGLHSNERLSVLMLLIIAQCSKLKSLNIPIPFMVGIMVGNDGADERNSNDTLKTLIPKGIAASHPKASWMSNLRTVRLTCEGSDPSGVEEPMTGLDEIALNRFYLPRLEELEIDHLSDPFSEDVWEDTDHEEKDRLVFFWSVPRREPPIAKYLKTLRLIRCTAPSEALDALLEQTPVLEVLEYDYQDVDPQQPHMLSRVKDALKHVQRTLKSFTFHFEIFLHSGRHDHPSELHNVVDGGFGSFHDYHALMYLEISLQTLIGLSGWSYSHKVLDIPLADALPPNLQHLTVTDNLYGYSDFVCCFEDVAAMAIFERYIAAGEWKTATPHLKKFKYDLRENGHDSEAYWQQEERRVSQEDVPRTGSRGRSIVE